MKRILYALCTLALLVGGIKAPHSHAMDPNMDLNIDLYLKSPTNNLNIGFDISIHKNATVSDLKQQIFNHPATRLNVLIAPVDKQQIFLTYKKWTLSGKKEYVTNQLQDSLNIHPIVENYKSNKFKVEINN